MLAIFSLCAFMDRVEVEVHKNRKKGTRLKSCYIDRASLVSEEIIVWHSTYSCLMSLCVFTFVSAGPLFVAKCILNTHQHFLLSLLSFSLTLSVFFFVF